MEEGLGMEAGEGASPVVDLVRVGEPARPGIGTVVVGAFLVAGFEFGSAAGSNTVGSVAARGRAVPEVLLVDGPAALRIGVATTLRAVAGFVERSGFGLGVGLKAAFDAIAGFEARFGGGGFPIVGLEALAETKLSSSEPSAASPAFMGGDIARLGVGEMRIKDREYMLYLGGSGTKAETRRNVPGLSWIGAYCTLRSTMDAIAARIAAARQCLACDMDVFTFLLFPDVRKRIKRRSYSCVFVYWRSALSFCLIVGSFQGPRQSDARLIGSSPQIFREAEIGPLSDLNHHLCVILNGVLGATATNRVARYSWPCDSEQ